MSREIGDEFEDEICSLLNIKKTPNSGAMFNDGDMNYHGCIFECKVKNDEKSFKIPSKELTKLRKQAFTRFKDWVYIQRNASGDQVLVDIELFTNLWKAYTNKI